MTPLLEIDGLHVAVEGHEILRGVDLGVGEGELHALMGPNGSGKSTLASTLLGNPAYEVTSGAIRFRGEDVTAWPTDVHAKAGMFLAFQYPEEIPGVPVIQFLRQAVSGRLGDDRSVLEVRMAMLDWMKRLGMDPAFGERHLNEGFSGGEKKRNEILQMAMLDPELAVLDETDSGLDIDALRIVAEGVQAVRSERPGTGRAHRDPLHAHTGPPEARRGARPRGRQGRRPRWARAGGAPRGRGLRAVAELTVADSRADRERRVEASGAPCTSGVDFSKLKADFPILDRTVHGHRVVYLDSAASAQRPQSVLDAMDAYYRTSHANVHRGVYTIAEEADHYYESARMAVGRFIGAPDPSTRSSSPRTPRNRSTWSPPPGPGRI